MYLVLSTLSYQCVGVMLPCPHKGVKQTRAVSGVSTMNQPEFSHDTSEQSALPNNAPLLLQTYEQVERRCVSCVIASVCSAISVSYM